MGNRNGEGWELGIVGNNEFEERVLEAVKDCQQKKEAPLVWAMEVAKCVCSAGLGLPSAELGHLLVSQLCLSNDSNPNHNNPFLWKFLDQALSSALLSPLQVLALLTSRVIPHRWSQPEAYRLYLELLSKYTLSFGGLGTDGCREKIIKSVDVALQLSQTYRVQVLGLGHALVLCFFSITISLIDSTLYDWGFKVTSFDRASRAVRIDDCQNTYVDSKGNQMYKTNEHRERIRNSNSFMAFEVLAKLAENRKAIVLLRLVYLNMPEKFEGLLQRMQFLEVHKLSSPNLKTRSQILVKLSANIQKAMGFEYQLNKHQLIGMLIDNRSCKPALNCNYESGRSASWIPFDIYLENAMDGKQFPVTSAIDMLTETIYTLKIFNRASWHDTFLAIWLSALRLVQRERNPLEGPVPHLDSRLCALLSITPLAIARVLEDDSALCSSLQRGSASIYMENGYGHGTTGNDHALRKQGLISSLQVLGHYTALLCPPASVVNAANVAAAKAASFISNSKNVKDGISGGGRSDTFVKSGGDMRHLIVEACLARKLIDTSAYFWPGYVSASVNLFVDPSPVHKSPWSAFMRGTPLTGPLINALMTTPASSLAEVEKLYDIALNGLEEEKSAAAKILCGASLSHGWNIQEYVVHFVVKLLSPPIPPNFSGSMSHLVDYMSMLSAILFGASSIDTVHILSLHGVFESVHYKWATVGFTIMVLSSTVGKVPEVAASLMPLCETFGSLIPTSSYKSSTGDESSIYMVFSSAFLFLLRLWKFYKPPLEKCITGRGGAIGGELTLEYLLLLCNSRIQSHNDAAQDEMGSRSSMHGSTLDKPMYIDSYPKLRAWYCQNKSCIASTLSGLSSGNPVHQVANKILNMIYWKMTKSGAMSSDSSAPSCSSVGGPSASIAEHTYQRPMLPAWEVLEAIPLVLEAILTACAHGRLSSRDLTTGLRDLFDFLPASLAAIISYFSAELTRGIWKPVSMNGIDWPSPAANFISVESEIKEILGAVGVSVPSCSSGISTAMLPLPMAALVSLTITFKLDRSLEYIHAVAGLALENCASGCPWPSMPIIGSLWAQKVRRWHDFIVVSCSRSIFRQSQEAVAQLLRSCFSSFLGSLHLLASPLTSENGVNGLLGSFISAPGICPRVAPGFLYLRSCRTVQDVQHLSHVIVELVANSARELAAKRASTDSTGCLKSTGASLAVAISRAKEVATLGASLLCVADGFQLVQELYQETIPTWLLSARNEKHGEVVDAVSLMLEGYSMAYLLVLSGALIWDVSDKPPSWAFSRRLRVFAVHMEFVVGVLDGNISLGCDPATWKAYVSCLVGLVVNLAPVWIQQVKQETLRKLATGLRGWDQSELALSLLERGGVPAMGYVVELLNAIS